MPCTLPVSHTSKTREQAKQALYQVGKLVLARISDFLCCGRAVELEKFSGVTVHVLGPGCTDGILDGEEDGGSQEKGWFSNSLK